LPKQTLTLNDFSGGINNLKDPRDIANNEAIDIQNFMVDKQGAIRTRGAVASQGAIDNQAATAKGGYGLSVFELDRQATSVSVTGSSDITFGKFFNWAYIASSAVSLEDSFPVGSIILVENTTLNNKYFTVIAHETTLHWLFVDRALTANEVNTSAKISFHPYGSTLIALSDSTNGEVDFYSKEADSWAAGAMSLHTSAQTAEARTSYYSIDQAIRACDTDTINNAGIIKWYGMIQRTHFNGVQSNNVDCQDNYLGFFEELNSLSPPIEGKVHASDYPTAIATTWGETVSVGEEDDILVADSTIFSVGDYFKADDEVYKVTNIDSATQIDVSAAEADTTDAGHANGADITSCGKGFNISVTLASDTASTWLPDTYQVAFSFIYDENQESLLYVPTADNTFVVADGEKLQMVVRATSPFGPRVNGGRVYCRPSGNTDSPWKLLLDISLMRGVRASLTSDYEVTSGGLGWTAESGALGVANIQFSSETVEALSQNLDTYESINGYNSDILFNSIGADGEGWRAAIVTNRRTFVANVKVKSESSAIQTIYSDRIMYSMPNKFDTFPSHNYIDAVLGDAEEYIQLLEYADRLLAFKEKSVQVINISDDADTNWFIEENIKHNGIKWPTGATRTDYGVVWVNDNGCYIYNGNSIANLIDNKIVDTGGSLTPPSWSDFIQAYSMVGYEKQRKQLIIMKDCTGSIATSGDAYIYDFKTKSWVFAPDSFTDQKEYTNFIYDWDGYLVTAYDSSGTMIFQKWDNDSTATTGMVLTTKDMDFGDPARVKKIYKVYATYKSSATQANPMEYSVDGKASWTDMTTGAGTITTDDGASDTLPIASAWDVATFSLANPISCQSIQFKLNPPSSGTFDINDISIEYRPLRKKVS